MHHSDMQEKRNVRLLILLGVLTTITIGVFFMLNTNTSTVVDKALFKLSDYSTIDKVILEKGNKTIELKFEGARWKVNDQLADRSMIDVLFATLQQVEPKRPVAESLGDSLAALLDTNGVMIKLFEGDNLLKKFIAGGNATKTQAYFKYPEEVDAYVMVIPGYRVYASGIFELEEYGWKDRYVFNFNWRNFKSLKASFPNTPQSDFEVAMGKSYFEILGTTAVDTTKLNDFLDIISLVEVDQYVDQEEIIGYDSLLAAKPLMKVEVSDISGKTYSLSLYDQPNLPQVLGLIQGTYPAYLDKKKMKGLLKEKAWFMKN
jgi:Domain of unknown function (DUF4340)